VIAAGHAFDAVSERRSAFNRKPAGAIPRYIPVRLLLVLDDQRPVAIEICVRKVLRAIPT